MHWSVKDVLQNYNAPLKFINKYIECIDWHDLSYNTNLTWKFIYKHKDKSWDWNTLSCNEFDKNEDNTYMQKILIYKKEAYTKLYSYNDCRIPTVVCDMIIDFTYY